MKSEISAYLRGRSIRAHASANRALSRAEFERGESRVASKPHFINLAATTYCNLKCVICPHGNDEMKDPKHLSDELLERHRDFVSAAKRVMLQGVGEPLMSPAFWRMLEYFDADAGIDIDVHSNATLLTDDRIEKLLASSLTAIVFSLDAVRPETYRKIRGRDLDRVTDGIRRLVKRRAELGSRRLKIFTDMTLMRENIEEVPAFVDWSADLGVDGVQLKPLLETDIHLRWKPVRDGWTFDYKEQLLRHTPKLSNDMIREGARRAKERGLVLLFDEARSTYFEENA